MKHAQGKTEEHYGTRQAGAEKNLILDKNGSICKRAEGGRREERIVLFFFEKQNEKPSTRQL